MQTVTSTEDVDAIRAALLAGPNGLLSPHEALKHRLDGPSRAQAHHLKVRGTLSDREVQKTCRAKAIGGGTVIQVDRFYRARGSEDVVRLRAQGETVAATLQSSGAIRTSAPLMLPRDALAWFSAGKWAFELIGTVEKTRRTFEVQGLILTGDTVKNLGDFFQVSSDHADDLPKMRALLERLNPKADIIEKSYFSLWREKVLTFQT